MKTVKNRERKKIVLTGIPVCSTVKERNLRKPKPNKKEQIVLWEK